MWVTALFEVALLIIIVGIVVWAIRKKEP